MIDMRKRVAASISARGTRGRAALWGSSVCLVIGCGSSDGSSAAIEKTDTTKPGPPADSFVSGSNDGRGGGPSTSAHDDDPNATCTAAVAQGTRAPVDLIVLVDTSGSMVEEAAQVQANLNRFSEAIGALQQDVHVIVVAERGAQPGSICVPPPLGGAGCGDRLPAFLHVPVEVASSDALLVLLDLYADQWTYLDPDDFDVHPGPLEPVLRPDAFKAIVVVSDDNSRMNATQFEARLFAEAGAQFGSAQARRYSMNPIVGWQRGSQVGSTSKCATAVNSGAVYQSLAQTTGGIVESVCESDFSSVLETIARGVVEKTACDIALPAGATNDPSKVEVRLSVGGAGEKLTPVTDVSKCGANAHGWYYDDPGAPTHVVLCPDACKAASTSTATSEMPKVEVLIGCKAPAPR